MKPALAASVAVILVASTCRAEQPPCPEAARQRLDEAVKLSTSPGRHADAAAAYRAVADWPEGGTFKERPYALYMCAKELELAGELERALATYREVPARFPEDALAGVARRDANRLDPPGTKGGLEFRRRHAEAVEGLPRAFALVERRENAAARPALERSLGLLLALRRDFPEHPDVVSVAITASDVLVRLERLDDALASAEEALALARARAAAPEAPTNAAADVVSATRQVDEARRAIRLRRVGLGAKVLLAALAVAWSALRPWRRVTRRVAALLAGLLVVDGLAAAAGAYAAEYVRRVHAPSSPITSPTAALFVFVPGLVGALLSAGFALSLRGKKGTLLAALLGLLGALAVTTCLVERYGFFDFLPDV